MPLEERYRKKMVLGQDGNHLVNLVVIIGVVFMIFKLIFVIYHLAQLDKTAYYTHIFDWFRLPAEFDRMMTRPWTIITYMFMHDGVFHVLGNLLWLWAFGYIMQDLAGNGKIIPIFLYGGFAGALFFLASYNIIPKLVADAPGSTLEGASAGVMAVAVATTMLAPDYRIFPMLNGGIPLWVLTVIFVIIDFATLPVSNTGGHIAHIAGAATGFVFIYQMRKGNDWSTWMNAVFNWAGNLFNPNKPQKAKPQKQKYFYKVGKTSPYKKVPNVTQKRIDEILDKINMKGYRFLTEEEKEILRRASEDDNL
ncbi:MAG TPA: rhomboid family intramembrane serine protease [Chitinophagaceae bacterium]|nr:rhomboid family intramembrane serine protease [Chitinophagaceae bacterium]